MIEVELVIRHTRGEEDLTCPVFTCDYCKKKIDHLHEGMYHWKQNEDGSTIPGTAVVLHFRCADIIEAREGNGRLTPWWHLQWLFGYLPNNYNYPWSKIIDEYCPDEQLKQVSAVVQKRLRAST